MIKELLPLLRRSTSALLVLMLLFSLLFIASCTKEKSSNTEAKQRVTIRINDNPVRELTNVWVDIQYVEVKVDTTTRRGDYDDDDDDDDDDKDCDRYGTWDTLKVTPGIYDILRFRNGLDTMLATGFVSSGTIHKVRITLGNRNEVSKDSGVTRIPLSICNRKPYVYVKLKDKEHTEIVNGEVRIQLDFDIARSISYRNSRYCLQPYIKAYSKNRTGSIEGEVWPLEANAMPMAYNATDTGYAMPDRDGEFEIHGLKPGTYSLRFNPSGNYRDTVLTGIEVKPGKETELRKIILKP
ncbi:MAG: DUF4382 domain-containing protein [Lacibacter sp.]|jgi:hypothetical protein